MLQFVCELICIFPGFSMINSLINSSHPSTCHSVFCKHSPCHWGQTLDRLTSSQRKYCWFTMTLQILPALLTLAPPAQMLPWQQLLCYGLGEGLWGQMTKISYSKETYLALTLTPALSSPIFPVQASRPTAINTWETKGDTHTFHINISKYERNVTMPITTETTESALGYKTTKY